MRIIIEENYEDMGRTAAAIVKEYILQKPDCVFGCATGTTPIGMYEGLVRAYKAGELDFSNTRFFNLDEYCGLDPSNDQSYTYFMKEHLFNYINASPANIHLPDGMAEDIDAACKRYDDDIARNGGIDLQVVGIGVNGHIGFNEPGDCFFADTHKIALHQSTIRANARFFPSIESVPTEAITMGVRPILQSKMLLFLANGESKIDAVFGALRGPITPHLPASILQLHPNVVAVLDRSAAKKL
jgi:glucosamine-6-phosphate deaminase